MVDLNFKKLGGLIPVIAQDCRTNEVLMMAYMNREAWDLTTKTGYAHYWSRSRNRLWKKGETSGNLQAVKEIRLDCDSDCVLIKIHQKGDAACHTGYRSCFYKLVTDGNIKISGQKVFDPEQKY